MAFLGGIGKVFSGIGNAVKGFLGSSIGQFALKTLGNLVAPGIGGIIAGAAGNLLSGKKLLPSILGAAKNAFGGVAGKLAGGLVGKLPIALQAPFNNIANSLLNGEKLSVKGVVSNLLKNTKLGGTLNKVIDQAQKFLGVGTKITGDAQKTLGAISGLLSNFGINTGALDKASGFISKVMGLTDKVNSFINQASTFINGMPSDVQMLRA